MDGYDRHIEECVMMSGHLLEEEWRSARGLFQFITPDGYDEGEDCDPMGCLTMIRGDSCILAWEPELTEAIRADERIPTDMENFCACVWPDLNYVERRAKLQVFAEWQRRVDLQLNRGTYGLV